MSSLAAQLDAMMAEHKRKTDFEVEALNRMQSALKHADTHIMQQVQRILAEHEMRRGSIVTQLEELRGALLGLPQPEERFAMPRIFQGQEKQIAANVSQEVDYLFQRGPH